MTLYECAYCGDTYRSAHLAASCCDPISNDLDDEIRSVN